MFFSRLYFAVLVLVLMTCRYGVAFAYDDDFDYVKEVLEEDEMQYDEQRDSEEYQANQRLQAEEAEKQRQAEQRRIEREHADRIAAERERAFEKELAKMNEDQKKAALKQKKKDSRIVKAILKTARKTNHYGVLGMKNWNLRIPERKINIAGLKFTIPGITLKQTTTKDVKRAFRVRTKLVHPDKNRDGRATEAFIAVENAASILSDEKSKSKYDDEMRLLRQDQQKKSKAIAQGFLATTLRVFRAVLAVLGPFATPVLIIGALII